MCLRRWCKYFEGGTSVTNVCCHDLIYVVKTCHDLFFKSDLASKPNVDKSRTLANSVQVWSQCVATTVSPTSSLTYPENKMDHKLCMRYMV